MSRLLHLVRESDEGTNMTEVANISCLGHGGCLLGDTGALLTKNVAD